MEVAGTGGRWKPRKKEKRRLKRKIPTPPGASCVEVAGAGGRRKPRKKEKRGLKKREKRKENSIEFRGSFLSPSSSSSVLTLAFQNVELLCGRRGRGLGRRLLRSSTDRRAHQPQARHAGGGRQARRRAVRGARIDRRRGAAAERRRAGPAADGERRRDRPRDALPLAESREARRGLRCGEAREARALAR